MSNSMKDMLKNKVRSSVHTQLIDTNNNTNTDVNKNVNVNVFDKPRKKQKFEDTHTRQTYYIENRLLAQLNDAAGDEKGEKTRIINEAIRQYLNIQT